MEIQVIDILLLKASLRSGRPVLCALFLCFPFLSFIFASFTFGFVHQLQTGEMAALHIIPYTETWNVRKGVIFISVGCEVEGNVGVWPWWQTLFAALSRKYSAIPSQWNALSLFLFCLSTCDNSCYNLVSVNATSLTGIFLSRIIYSIYYILTKLQCMGFSPQ